MTTYKGIKGLSIQTVAGDPSNLENGMIWYDSVAKKVQGAKLAAGSWSSGGNMSQALIQRQGFGIYTAGQVSGGNNSGGNALGICEQYDGSSWSEVSDQNTNRSYAGGCGTQAAGIIYGGLDHPGAAVNVSEEWDGSSFAEGDNLNAVKYNIGNTGTQTAAIAVGGIPGTTAQFESYNGTSWTEEDHGLVNARAGLIGWGISTSALMAGGDTVNVETYNGTAWTEVNNLNTGKGQGGTSKNTASIGTNGIVFGGTLTGTPHTATTELFDGTSWTEQGDLPVASNGLEGFGTGGNAVSAGGNSPPNTYLNTTNEWTGAATAAVTFTSS